MTSREDFQKMLPEGWKVSVWIVREGKDECAHYVDEEGVIIEAKSPKYSIRTLARGDIDVLISIDGSPKRGRRVKARQGEKPYELAFVDGEFKHIPTTFTDEEMRVGYWGRANWFVFEAYNLEMILALESGKEVADPEWQAIGDDERDSITSACKYIAAWANQLEKEGWI